VLAFTYGFLKIPQNPNADILSSFNSERFIGNNNTADTIPPAGFPFPTIFNFNYAAIPNMNAGTVGAMYLFGKYYFNRWNLTQTYIYDSTGVNGGPGVMRTVSYVGGNRDLTTDGRYLYGGNTLTTLYRMDTNMATLDTFTITGAKFGAVAWDKGRNGFWNCGKTGNITCHDTDGVVLGDITNSYNSKTGLAFDSVTAVDTGFVWCWDQGPGSTGPNRLTKFIAATGTQLAVYNFSLVAAALAGGAEIVVYPGNPSRKTLLLNYQNFALVAYKMADILTSIENKQSMISGFSLNQNYPNPFNPSTKISFNLMKMNNVILSVYDTAGKLVKTLVNRMMEAGDHTITFDASNLATGIYYYTISSGDFKDTKKMVLLK
jgi:hypothetical protein